MTVLFYLSYVAVLVAFGFVTLSVASGLLYISELIEEHSRLAKIIGQRGIYAVIAMHIILYFTDSLPLKLTLFSIFCHIVYLQNFSSAWPSISLTSITLIASCALVIADHFLWFFHFAHLTQDAKHQRYYKGRETIQAPSFVEVATFFGMCVWMAPLFLFLSLSANDNAIPLSSAEPNSPTVMKAQFRKQPTQSLFRSVFSKLPGKFSRKASEGLIAPPSPSIYRSASSSSSDGPLLSPTIGRTYQNPPSAPPKSPGPMQTQAPEFYFTKNPNGSKFKLATPPRRPSSGLRSSTLGRANGAGVSSEGLGLGLSLSGVSADKKED